MLWHCACVMNNTTPHRRSQAIRDTPPWLLNALIRRAGLNHLDVAERAGVSESQVSHTINRRRRNTEACEKVWKALEALLP